MNAQHARVWLFSIIGLFLGAGPVFAAAPEFGAEQFVQAGGIDIQVPGYSVPSLADWNGDGLNDLIVGEGGGGYSGKVRVYLNIGTKAEPQFRDYVYAQAGTSDLTCTPIGCMGCFPRVVDWDEDGRIDLLIGQADGTVRIHTNFGLQGSPAFSLGTAIVTADGSVHDMDVGDRATPVVVDWNSDSMLDIVSGGLDGLIHVYPNCGCEGSVPPRFLGSPAGGQIVQADGKDLAVPSGRSSPVIMDLDGDGMKDILTGNTEGQILFYKNTGSKSLPTFSGYSPIAAAGTAIDLPGTLRSRPFVCQWSSDGTTDPNSGNRDLLVGYGDGKVRLYRSAPAGSTLPEAAKAGDLDGDGDIDGDDFTILAKAMDKQAGLEGNPADLNHDYLIDMFDLRIFADLWLMVHK